MSLYSKDDITLVTGASGFVGSVLVSMMRERGMQVRDVSRTSTNAIVKIPSYGADTDWSDSLRGITTVVHLAARVHVMRETSIDPLTLFRESNVAATLNLARQAAKSGVRRFIFISTIKVNGEYTELGKPFTALDKANPQDPYSVSKAEAEKNLLELGCETGMEIVIIRPPLVYGPDVRGNFKLLMKWVSSGIPSIFSRVHNKRSLIYVGNLSELIIRVVEHKNIAGKILLVSDGYDISTHELLTSLARSAGRTPRSLAVPLNIIKFSGIILRRSEIIERLTNSLQVDLTATLQAVPWLPDSRTPLLLSSVWGPIVD
ncbi:NAD-dependent epimerase/dehydratase family protein [Agrobacterium tumefaciens]|uniref:NAD-dependent epimerase/dehydratase family protein n=1 Tax=Agrobacterium tumefaciens TaxID=358 RepID=UPI0027D8067F|nr:NAD-dependent epimerase/dehydratase family protein [Agrobacterium tumefaciens]